MAQPGGGHPASSRAGAKAGRLSDPRTLLGRVISDRYRIEELIGEGGMGAVYRARHTQLHTSLAIKVLHPEMLGLTEAVARFEREAVAGAYIKHPNVASAADFGKLEDGSHFLVLELLEGRDLRSLIAQGPLRLQRALKIARQIALALGAAHALGIVHRDLKPENVMLVMNGAESDFVKVFDFGIAKVPVENLPAQANRPIMPLTMLGVAYGTPEYMAPEQALGEEIDGRADLYALGVILYEMLCGVRPFESNSRVTLLGMVASHKPPSFAERVPAARVPGRIETIVMRLLEKKPASRFGSAGEVVSALDAAADDLDGAASAQTLLKQASMPPPAAAEPHKPSPAERSVPRRHTTIPAAALLAGGGIVATTIIVLSAVVLRGPDGGSDPGQAEQSASATGSVVPASAVQPAASRSAPTRPAAPGAPDPAKAPTDEFDTARIKGLAALTALAKKYPRDTDVIKALILIHARTSDGLGEAMRGVKQLFEIAPAKASDEEIQKVVLRSASGKPGVADLAFEVMSKRMDSRGPDLLYELLIASGVGKYTKERATSALRDREVRSRATPALLIAFDLFMAPGCAKKPLFARAEKDGDKRALHLLKPLTLTKGCGLFRRTDCYPCLQSRAELYAAIKAIDARSQAAQN